MTQKNDKKEQRKKERKKESVLVAVAKLNPLFPHRNGSCFNQAPVSVTISDFVSARVMVIGCHPDW